MADDYIKREDAIQAFANEFEGILDLLESVPAADVREVVTCAKCRYYSEKRKECGHINGLSELVFPTDYCSYGSVMREVEK